MSRIQAITDRIDFESRFPKRQLPLLTKTDSYSSTFDLCPLVSRPETPNWKQVQIQIENTPLIQSKPVKFTIDMRSVCAIIILASTLYSLYYLLSLVNGESLNTHW
ncbi:Oidioi.mRNA.OKI2018_I69.chr1.g1766.t1.cds [Oikopleura dioica]|uniref:Oidioi.mRNA.OKI2018_I69.chr1.g1766.t1.cds n=1 Tax=Oikopleura dioica TaxID=34765 RepID=A0ABN7SNY0_OIKDI|nr:Oidioi.mRNA.OKI2018_I69.chr1.g1766.t1.cds [Oikopleura dioica]